MRCIYVVGRIALGSSCGQRQITQNVMLRLNSTISGPELLYENSLEHRLREDQDPRLRILMIVECSGGGTGRHVLDLSQCLIERGCEVHILYSRGRIDRMFETRLDAITSLYSQVVPMRTAPHPSDWSAWRAIRRYMRAHGPFDVIHGHSSKGGALARLAALGTGVSAYYTLHGLIMLD